MLSSGAIIINEMKCYHLGWNVIIWDEMLSSVAKVIIWDEMLSSGMKCYHPGWNVIIWDEMLSSGAKVIIWDEMLSSGMKCYHLGYNVIIWYAMLSSGAIIIIWDKMLSSGMQCYPLVLSCDVIIWDDNTPLFYFSWKLHSLRTKAEKVGVEQKHFTGNELTNGKRALF